MSESTPPVEKSRINIKRALSAQERELRSKYHFAIGYDRKLWMYQDGKYHPDAITFLQRWVREVWSGQAHDELWDPNFAHRIAASISAAYAPSLWDKPPFTQLNVQNGILYHTSNGWRLEGHSPGWLSSIQLPVAYDPGAKCPNWEQLQSDLFPDDQPDLLFKLIAWLMGPEGHGSQVAVLLLGEYGGEGKSTVINAICRFLGESNFMTSNLTSLQNNRFSTAYIQNKLAVICPDLPTTVLKETEVFKKIVTCDFVEAEYKGGARFQFKPYAKVLCAGNRIPASTEGGDAWKRRWLPISFSKKPSKRYTPAEMAERLYSPEELSGVLNRALAYYMPIQQSGMPIDQSTLDYANSIFEQRDPLYNWILSHCTYTPGLTTEKAIVYRAYTNWCEQRNQSSLSERAFGFQLHKVFPKLASDRGPRQDDGSRPPIWTNLHFK